MNEQQLNNKINSLNLWKNLNWLDKRKDYISCDIEHIKKTINTLIPILESHYKDLWDIQFKFLYEDISPEDEYDDEGNLIEAFPPKYKLKLKHFFVIIKFPEITVTNTPGRKIKLYDFFINVPFSCVDEYINMKRVQGALLSPTKIQYQSNYKHSHLETVNNKNFHQFTSFCTGSGDINTMQGDINDYFNNMYNFDENLFEMFFHHLKNFVAWESLEGTPYFRMSGVIKKDSGKLPIIHNYNLQSYYEDFKYHIFNQNIKLQWTIKEGYYSIKDNEYFENLILINNRFSNSELCYKDEKGEYISVQYAENSININVGNGKYIIFKGEKVVLSIKNTNTDLSDTLKKYVHPQIKNYIKSKIENEYNKQKFKDKYFRAKN